MSALKPIGRLVRRRMRRRPARKSWPWTYVSEIGCTIPMPPASDTAATSSGLLHGYIAPQMSGTSTPAWRVNGVANALDAIACADGVDTVTPGTSCPLRANEPSHGRARDVVTTRITDRRLDLDLARLGELREHDGRLGRERSPRLLDVVDREPGDDSSKRWRKPREHRESARHLGQVDQCHRMHGSQMISHDAPVAHLGAHESRPQFHD